MNHTTICGVIESEGFGPGLFPHIQNSALTGGWAIDKKGQHDNPNDETLLHQIQNQDSDAFEQLHTRYAAALTRHVRSIVHDANASADLVQEVFIRVWQRAEQWQPPGSVKAWLYTIATNLSLNHLRSLRRRPQQSLEKQPRSNATYDGWSQDDGEITPAWMIDAASLRPDTLIERAEARKQVWQNVDELPRDKSDVLHMVYEFEMDLRSVADALEIPEGTVKSRLYHGRRQLAQRWQDDEW